MNLGMISACRELTGREMHLAAYIGKFELMLRQEQNGIDQFGITMDFASTLLGRANVRRLLTIDPQRIASRKERSRYRDHI